VEHFWPTANGMQSGVCLTPPPSACDAKIWTLKSLLQSHCRRHDRQKDNWSRHHQGDTRGCPILLFDSSLSLLVWFQCSCFFYVSHRRWILISIVYPDPLKSVRVLDRTATARNPQTTSPFRGEKSIWFDELHPKGQVRWAVIIASDLEDLVHNTFRTWPFRQIYHCLGEGVTAVAAASSAPAATTSAPETASTSSASGIGSRPFPPSPVLVLFLVSTITIN